MSTAAIDTGALFDPEPAGPSPGRQGRLPFRPLDRADVEAWNGYLHHVAEQEPADSPEKSAAGSLGLERLAALAQDLRAQSWNRVWMPCCALSPVPTTLAREGLDVLATDPASAAIEFQRAQRGRARADADEAPSASRDVPGARFEQHDPRQGPPAIDFDLVLCLEWPKLYRGDDLASVGRSLFASLTAERTAIFDLGPTPTEERQRVETALVEAGFHVPLFELHRWYRSELLASGIPHSLVLDLPTVRRTNELAHDAGARRAATAKLQKIHQEMLRRRPRAETEDQARLGPETRLAEMLYSAA